MKKLIYFENSKTISLMVKRMELFYDLELVSFEFKETFDNKFIKVMFNHLLKRTFEYNVPKVSDEVLNILIPIWFGSIPRPFVDYLQSLEQQKYLNIMFVGFESEYDELYLNYKNLKLKHILLSFNIIHLENIGCNEKEIFGEFLKMS